MNASARTLTAEPAIRAVPQHEAAPAVRPPAARPASQRQPSAPAAQAHDAEGAAAARILAGARPWWFAFPGVMLTCANVVLAPLRLVIQVAEAAVALALLGVLGVGLAWYLGYVADKDVVVALKPIGQRILAMVQSAGGG